MQEFKEHLEDEGVADSYADTFDSLSEMQQAQFVAVLTSGDLDQPGVEATESTDIEIEPAGTSGSLLNGSSRNQSLKFAIYNVTSTISIDAKLFGLSLGYWKQVYKYRTGNKIVQYSDQCNGTWTGFSGFWAVSASTTHYKSGAYGHCTTIYTGSVVYKGSNVQVNKEYYQKVGGAGRLTWSMKNI